MQTKEWLGGFSGQTTDELIACEAAYRVDSIVLAFEEGIQKKAYASGDHMLSFAERVVLAVEALEREVNNGGYDQFFVNSSNEYVPVIVNALEKIGCPEIAEITRRAIALQARGLQEELEVCDKDYLGCATDLAEPLFEYIKKNRAEIVL